MKVEHTFIRRTDGRTAAAEQQPVDDAKVNVVIGETPPCPYAGMLPLRAQSLRDNSYYSRHMTTTVWHQFDQTLINMVNVLLFIVCVDETFGNKTLTTRVGGLFRFFSPSRTVDNTVDVNYPSTSASRDSLAGQVTSSSKTFKQAAYSRYAPSILDSE